MGEIVKIRASGFSEIFDCPARWFARTFEGKRGVSTGRAYLGTSVHHATAIFDQAELEAAPITVDDAAGIFVDCIHAPEDLRKEVVWDNEDLTVKDAEEIGLSLTTRYCFDIAPRIDYAAVELQCKPFDIEMGEDLTIRLTGTLDRIRIKNQHFGISDLKTGKRICDQDGNVDIGKNVVQLATYELLELMARDTFDPDIVLPAQIIGLPTTEGRPIGITSVKLPHKLLLGDEKYKGLLEMAADLIRKRLFWGNPRSMLCSERYCPAWRDCRWRGFTLGDE